MKVVFLDANGNEVGTAETDMVNIRDGRVTTATVKGVDVPDQAVSVTVPLPEDTDL